MQTGSFGEDTQQQVDRLASEHLALKTQVHELESHLSLTSLEWFELVRLKKLKLHTKDQLYTLSRR